MMQNTLPSLSLEYIELLQKLIRIPSYSREEASTATCLSRFLEELGYGPHRSGNNLWLHSRHNQSHKPSILLNSHHDTVKPVASWTRDPFEPTLDSDLLFGLGSNDAGASLLTQLATFIYLDQAPSPPAFNLIWSGTAEEEISGPGGIASILDDLGPVDLAIVGEPTQMQMAIAEKGLMVVDCYAEGVSGHAAREEGLNAIYQALPDIHWIQNYRFPKISDLLGPVKVSVTQIKAGTQHNVVPDACHFVLDVRTNELYSNAEVAAFLTSALNCRVEPRSLRLNSSGIAFEHPFVQKGLGLGLSTYGSPTLSDQALIPYTSIKIGPGDSSRSHTADEFIRVSEMMEGFQIYVQLLENLEL